MENDDEMDSEIEIVRSEEEDREGDTATYDIISYGADYTLSVFYDKMKKEELIIPGFQRGFVWNFKQASKLVESFLLGLPVPGIFLAKEKETGNLLVIDGQQRLVTCEAFRNEKFPITYEDFSLRGVKAKWEGLLYSQLDPVDRKRFDDSVLRATIIQQVNPEGDTSIYHIFQRLNTGGSVLRNQEIRNCLYHGKFNDMLHRLNRNKSWRSLYISALPHKRMKDEELILRFLSLYYNFANYSKPMNEFMSKFMDRNRNPDNTHIEQMEKIFNDTISFISREIGPNAFRPRGNINTAAFDSITYIVAKYRSRLKDNISENIAGLYKDTAYLEAILEGTTDPETIKRRFSIAQRYLVEE